jgi:glucokinase
MAEAAVRTLAVDLGGTWMRAALVTADGELVSRRAEATPRHAACPEALLALVGDLLDCGNVGHAVIGVPGRVDYRRGRLEWAPNLPPHWPAALDRRPLSERLGVDVSLANDADLAAVGESYFGAGRGYDDVVYLTVSTGIGAGVLLRRRLVAGTRSLAEVGHTVIDLAALRRGDAATLEELGSGTALGRRAVALGLPSDGARIVELVHAADPDAVRLWNDLVSAIGIGVANLGLLFTPEAIVLGGGVGRNGDLLLPPVRQYLATHGPRDLPTPIQVLVAELGDDAALAGAAAWQTATSVPARG